ncbi:putative membrane protein YphA (DoxX/SURF4 family) [Bacillus pakistanensis]|uniref:Membrane protein YphA (DoxX/SURF4 family) n=1 Tax=Rossellomorea pakistanensis TaxID=992288 RepID=A0ABS2NE99_9BACI|nr:DoxX family protein [Bacillus pakistanensis]MBM7586177.1 putative membrane protein YphA (DoxX/SURF4 family) [Bacillus pakistanensis]
MLRKYEIGAFILRILLGFTFFIHGLAKFQDGIENTVGFFESIGLPGFSAYVVAGIELIGGIALILGIGTRVISVLLALIMIGAIFKVKLAGGFLGNGQMAGFELDLALLAISAYLALTNRSAFALDNVIFQSKRDNQLEG